MKLCSTCLRYFKFSKEYRTLKKAPRRVSDHWPEKLYHTGTLRLCDRHHAQALASSAEHRARKIEAIPSWADLQKIQEIYSNCPPGHEVDHIVPLNGLLVRGFHVENNLQYLLKADNRKKSNKFTSE